MGAIAIFIHHYLQAAHTVGAGDGGDTYHKLMLGLWLAMHC